MPHLSAVGISGLQAGEDVNSEFLKAARVRGPLVIFRLDGRTLSWAHSLKPLRLRARGQELPDNPNYSRVAAAMQW